MELIKTNISEINKDKKIIIFSRPEPYSYHDNYTIFKSANIFLMPSLSRAPDKTYLEALCCGVTAIGTNVAYPFIEKKLPRLIYNARDTISLIDRITWAIDNQSKVKILTDQAQRFVVREFSLVNLMKRIKQELE